MKTVKFNVEFTIDDIEVIEVLQQDIAESLEDLLCSSDEKVTVTLCSPEEQKKPSDNT